jgi:hypothetical protein
LIGNGNCFHSGKTCDTIGLPIIVQPCADAARSRDHGTPAQ